MTNILIGIALGIAIRHFWTPIRVWLVHTAWPWVSKDRL